MSNLAQCDEAGKARSEPDDPFHRLWQLGYRKIVPIAPPDAEIHPKSTLARRLGTAQDGRGKAPGILGGDGLWRGLNWLHHDTTEADLVAWAAMGAGVGIRTGDVGRGLTLAAIDSDARDPELSRIVRGEIERRFGSLPLRIGRDPKGLYPILVRGEFPYACIEFGDRDEKGRLTERLEILTDGRQFVAEGIHPGTRQPYRWDRPLPPLDELPVVEASELLELLEALRGMLPAAGDVVREGGSGKAPANQNLLRGELKFVRQAVESMANPADLRRGAYIDVGYAIKAAVGPEHEAEGRAIYAEWAERWEGAGEDLLPGALVETAEADFDRCKPPFRRGATWLWEQAERLSNGAFSQATPWFDHDAASRAPLFPEEPSAPAGAATYELLSIGDLLTRPDPVFMLARHIPEASLGFLYGDPGTGKSFIALDWALHMAFGLPNWHGDEIRLPNGASVVYIAAEGASGFKTRVRAWMKAHGIAPDHPGRFGLIFQNVNFMAKEDVARLATTLRSRVAGQTCLLVVDTVSRAMPGADENLQKEMTLFVEACQSLQREFGATVLGVHHANTKGDMRGSSVLKGAGDFVFKLDRKSGARIGALRCEKQKDAPDGWSDNYSLDIVHVDEGQSALVPTRCEAPSAAGLTPAIASRILNAIEAAWANGEPWSASHQAKSRYAVNKLCADFGFDADNAKAFLAHIIGTGAVEIAEFSRKDHSKGLRVCWDRHDGSTEADDMSETEGLNVFG